MTYHGDAVVEQRFAEDDDVEQLIDVDRLEDGENSDWVDGGQQRREDESVQQWKTDVVAEHTRLSDPPQRQPDQQRVHLHANERPRFHTHCLYFALIHTARLRLTHFWNLTRDSYNSPL